MKKVSALFSVLLALLTAPASAQIQARAEYPLTALSAPVEVTTQSYYYYNFGTIYRGSSRSTYFSITNTGRTPLTFGGVYVSGIDFNAYYSCPRILEPGRSCQMEVRYWPLNEGWHRGRVNVTFYEASSLVIDVEGRATRW